ncbi:histone-lysine N-methyltransferase SETMAR [Trichonephila inaurata madagascariensis]|uniref:Histone-lysine N-methyltransferase SETMAR n=1 Tax=Trichonephila inaurata madagascariensis TaxID=2747483 RepID=A0A8X6XUT2_9ARAC|nr:histone-lysine N-methyltransferase SETMAR [Trichonephila inaurata madagascariensis]
MRVENHSHTHHSYALPLRESMESSSHFAISTNFWGKGTISKNQCREWFARFKSGDTSLKDKPGRGLRSDFDDQALLAAVEEDESLTTRMLAEEFNVNQSKVVRCLKKLRKVGEITGWAPHELSNNSRVDRVRIFSELLQRNEQKPFLKNLVTGDESWLLFKKVKRKKVCVSPGVSSKGIPKHVHCKKAMWCVWWDRSAHALPSKWEAVIKVDGDYIPE